MKKILSPKIDVVFRMLFGEQKHERITKKLIEDVIEEKVEKIELIKTKLVQKNEESRPVPINIEGSNYEIDIDYVVMALGSTVTDEVLYLGLTLNKWGNIYVNEKYQSSNEKIFAGGDLVGCKGTVAWAARSGRDAANSINEYLKEKKGF